MGTEPKKVGARPKGGPGKSAGAQRAERPGRWTETGVGVGVLQQGAALSGDQPLHSLLGVASLGAGAMTEG